MGVFIRRLTGWTLADVASWENLRAASRAAAAGKRSRLDVDDWLRHEEERLLSLRADLLSGAFEPGGYRFFIIHEPKRREIAAAPFRDRVVHHALCRFMAPAIERRFIARSFSCQLGKGTDPARECCRRLTNRRRFVLKCDVRKFFPSIDHAILRNRLEGVSRCSRAMDLVSAILGSYETGDRLPPDLFPGEDLFGPPRARGLPIGNLTSQLWGNFVLDELDHWITESERHGDYLRYTDDFLVFGDDKRRLWELRAGIVDRLAGLRLRLAEPKSRLLSTGEGVPFCGFRFSPGVAPRILGTTKRRFELRRRQIAAQGAFRRLGVAVFAWYQFARYGNTLGLKRAYSRTGWTAKIPENARGAPQGGARSSSAGSP